MSNGYRMRASGLVKARPACLPAYSVYAQGMGDSLAGPLFLVLLPVGVDPNGMNEAQMLDISLLFSVQSF